MHSRGIIRRWEQTWKFVHLRDEGFGRANAQPTQPRCLWLPLPAYLNEGAKHTAANLPLQEFNNQV